MPRTHRLRVALAALTVALVAPVAPTVTAPALAATQPHHAAHDRHMNPLMTRQMTTYLYNLDNHRADAVVEREVRAILSTKPTTLDLIEVTGNRLPKVDGYRIIRADRDGPRARERGNIASYVREGLHVSHVDWIDLRGVWPRPHGGGMHEARSFLSYRIEGVAKVIGHQAPRNARGWEGLQREGIDAVADRMNRWRERDDLSAAQRLVERFRARILLWDGNAVLGDRGPNPADMANRIGGRVYNGHRIDHAVARNVKMKRIDVLSKVADVRLQSDHGRAVRFQFKVPTALLGSTR